MRISEAFSVFKMQELLNWDAKPKTIKNYQWAVHSLTDVVGDIDTTHLGIDHIILWKVHLRDKGLTPSSINTLLGRIRMLLKWLSENEMHVLDYRLIKREQELKNKPRTFLTPDEVERLKSATTNVRDYALITLYFSTGCRLSEILNLDRVDFENAELVDKEKKIYEVWVLGKGGKYRQAYFDREARQAVQAYLDDRTDHFRPLFISNQNRRLGGSRVENLIHQLTRRAGLDKHVTPHTLRHSFTSDLITNGAPISSVSELLGHANQTTTLNIYSHINRRQKISSYAKSHSHV